MYRYIECNRSNSDEHFKKFRHFDEVKSYINGLDSENMHQEALNQSVDESYLGSGDSYHNNPDVHVYRIKDISDAINTSVILDFDQKEDYQKLLNDQKEEFDADVDFLEICSNVGECDIY